MKFHHKNKHRAGYDLQVLCRAYPKLADFVFENKYQTQTIDFGNPKAVKALNKALLFRFYKVQFWDFPDTNLCPPIPGRVDYIHYLADLLNTSVLQASTKVLDIGTGASCVYPILGHAEYGWDFVASDIDEWSLSYAQKNIDKNNLNHVIKLRFQDNPKHILKGIVGKTERFAAVMCNPPFYKNEAEAIAAAERKLKGLKRTGGRLIRNFSGTQNELWCNGGEKAFIHNYIYESTLFKDQVTWFTTLVSKKDLVRGIKVALKKLNATEVKQISMGQGNKISRIVAWTFQ